ncbi:MAG: ABC transporter substrate-binding protein [Puniceicoccales bacterium]|jgi:polar amino acid transport system substrate-binding protein|nr:ABC transporter substrate-binding protein [Puniceicoccales bacterium]
MGIRNLLLFAASIVLCGCGEKRENDAVRIALSADYPPFEYVEDGKIVGFDVDLGRAVAAAMGRSATFQDIAFSAVLATLSSGRADMALSTVAITDERQKRYSFSQPYFHEELFVLDLRSKPIDISGKFSGLRVACQLGSTMELWLRQNSPNCSILSMDSNVQAVEALRAGKVDAVVVDGAQAKSFCARDGKLACQFLARTDSGYAIALKKGAPLLKDADAALKKLQRDGTVDALKKKWGLQ